MNKFHIGQTVEVISEHDCFGAYKELADVLKLFNWKYNQLPIKGKYYQVIKIAKHLEVNEIYTNYNKTIYVIESDDGVYLMSSDGLTSTEYVNENAHVRFENCVCIVSSISYLRIEIEKLHSFLGDYEGEIVFDMLCCNGLASNRFLVANRKNKVIYFTHYKTEARHSIEASQREFYLTNRVYLNNSVLNGEDINKYLHSINTLDELKVAFVNDKLYYPITDESFASDYKVLSFIESPIEEASQLGVVFVKCHGWVIVYEEDLGDFIQL